METTYDEDKRAIPVWREGYAPDAMPTKVNELFLPEGAKP